MIINIYILIKNKWKDSQNEKRHIVFDIEKNNLITKELENSINNLREILYQEQNKIEIGKIEKKEENNFKNQIERENMLYSQENERSKNEQRNQRNRLMEKNNKIENEALRDNYKQKYDMQYERILSQIKMDGQNNYIKNENEFR